MPNVYVNVETDDGKIDFDEVYRSIDRSKYIDGQVIIQYKGKDFELNEEFICEDLYLYEIFECQE